MIFVFGSNQSGIHGAGAARYAKYNHGAKQGVGEGLAGNSYAIPTKDFSIKTLPLDRIKESVDTFLIFARNFPSRDFKVTRIGCGLAGYTDQAIAPMFVGAPKNCLFDTAWKPFLGANYKYWGTQ